MFELIKRRKKIQATQVTGLGVLIECFRRLMPSFGRRACAGGALEHLASLPLTAQASLALVRLHKETLLLGVTPQSITLLTKGEENETGQATPPSVPALPLESLGPHGEGSSR
jgi:flagellar biogenesis protein FliO